MIPTWLTTVTSWLIVVLGGLSMVVLGSVALAFVVGKILRDLDLWWNFILWVRDRKGRQRMQAEAKRQGYLRAGS